MKIGSRQSKHSFVYSLHQLCFQCNHKRISLNSSKSTQTIVTIYSTFLKILIESLSHLLLPAWTISSQLYILFLLLTRKLKFQNTLKRKQYLGSRIRLSTKDFQRSKATLVYTSSNSKKKTSNKNLTSLRSNNLCQKNEITGFS